VLVGGVVIGGLVSALVLGRLADDRGLPGSVIAVVVLVLLALLSFRIALGELPPRGRRRSLAIGADDTDMRSDTLRAFRQRIPRVAASMHPPV
jgi:hypothetical protein